MNNDLGANKIVTETLEAIKKGIADNIITTGRQASGDTARSMHVVLKYNGGQLLGREGFDDLEEGHSGQNLPPDIYARIQKWIVDKKLPVDNLASATIAITRSIMEKGTIRWRYPDRNVFTPVINSEIAKLRKRLPVIINESIEFDLSI